MARREFSAVCGRHLLVMHGKVGMKGDNLPGGTLLGSMLMSDRGAALARARCAGPRHAVLVRAGRAPQPDPAAARARVRWLAGQLGQVPLVHMLEAGTSALWSRSRNRRVLVARSPGGLRVIQDECPTNLNAVGKSVGYLPVGQPGDMPGLRPVAGGAAPLALWASGTEIGLPGRAGESAMRLVCARLIDTVSGEVAAQFRPASQADAGTVALAQPGLSATWPPGRPCRAALMARQLAASWRIRRRRRWSGALVGRGGRGSRQADRPHAAGGAPEDVRDAGDGRRRLRRAVGNEAGKRKGASLPAFSRRRWAWGLGCRGPGRRRSRCWPARRPVRAARPATAGYSAGARRSGRHCAD